VSAIDVLKAMRREDVEIALDQWKKVDPSTRSAVLTGWDLALTGGVADADTLVGLRQAVEAGSKGVMEIACYIGSVLNERDKTAFSMTLDLAASPTAQGRIGALLCMPPQTPDALAGPILDALLHDRSKKVREMAVEWIRRHDLKEYLPMLEAMLTIENNQAVKEYAALVVGLVKDGYYVRPDSEPIHVTIKAKGGIYSGVVDPELARGLSNREIAEKVMSTNA